MTTTPTPVTPTLSTISTIATSSITSLTSLTTSTTSTTSTTGTTSTSSTTTPTPTPDDADDDDSGIPGFAVFIIVVLILAALLAGAWTLYRRWRAQRQGLPPPPLNPFARSRSPTAAAFGPAPAPGGIRGWVAGRLRQFRGMRNQRYATGAYEGARGGPGASRGFEPDEAWDTRVDETGYHAGSGGGGAYYEEEMQPPRAGGASYADLGPGGGGGGGGGAGYLGDRGRSREFDVEDEREQDPFGERAERSDWEARRFEEDAAGRSAGAQSLGDGRSSIERRSMFREDV